MTRVEFDYDHQELIRLEAGIRATGERSKEELERAITRAARAAEAIILAEGPRDSGELLSHVEIRFGNVIYAPGGAGGGGQYEAVVSIDDDDVPHLRFVYEGTGIFGPAGGNIEAAQGNVMAFGKRGEPDIFIENAEGQRPQTAWVENAAEAAEAAIAGEVSSFDIDRL
jgi:hypothetical protein